jgi:hypothetical protein
VNNTHNGERILSGVVNNTDSGRDNKFCEIMSVELNIKQNRYHFKNGLQIINMGGPWIGELFENDLKISNNAFIDTLCPDIAANRVFFVKYHQVSNKKNFLLFFERNVEDYFFTLNYYDFSTRRVFEYPQHFRMLFLGRIIDGNLLEIYEAFHGEFSETKSYFNLNLEIAHWLGQ